MRTHVRARPLSSAEAERRLSASARERRIMAECVGGSFDRAALRIGEAARGSIILVLTPGLWTPCTYVPGPKIDQMAL